MKARTVKMLVSVILCALLIMVVAVFEWLAPLEYRVQDAVFQEEGLIHPDIAIIGIDEHTLDVLGQWPWPRSVMAEAIQILNRDYDAKPAVIGIDVLFTEYNRFFPEGDIMLADTLRHYGDNVVLASSLIIGIDRDSLSLDPVVLGHVRPNSNFLPYVRYGIINGITDADGFIRNTLLWERYAGEVIYSFPVMISMMYQGVTEPDRFIRENSSMFLRYTGLPGTDGLEGDFFQFSFADIFEDFFDPAWLEGMIVLIGPYAIGMMDHFHVPILPGTHMYGVEIHANAIQAILDGAYKLRVPPWVKSLIFIAFIVFTMALGEFTDIRVTLGVFAAAGIGYFFAALFFYNSHYYVLPILTPLIIIGVVFIYQTIYGYVLDAIEKGKLRSTFKKYVDPKLVDALIESKEADSDGVGQKKNIAVIFVDVRGFTPMTEGLRETPELIVETLNEYLDLTASSVFNNGGSVDKFIGDATMALFNGFVPLDDYVYKAVKAAWDMVQGASEVNERIKEKFGIDIGFGVGVHCGEAIVGNLGPPFRKDYTAIGDTVNTAARLESNARRSQVLISKDVYLMLEGRITASSIGEIPLKGKSIPLEVYALTGVGVSAVQ